MAHSSALADGHREGDGVQRLRGRRMRRETRANWRRELRSRASSRRLSSRPRRTPVLAEIHRTWKRPEAAELAKLYGIVSPNYAAAVKSYKKA